MTRIAVAVASFITVPLLLGYLGVDRYGLWVTAATLTAWVALAHIGLPPSLLNRLAATGRAEGGARAALVTTAFWLSLILGVASLMPILVLDATGTWARLFNVEAPELVADARTFAITMWIGVAVAMPLAIPTTVLRADQEVHKANLVEAVGMLARVAAIVVVVQLGLGLDWLAAAAVAAPLAVSLVAMFRIFGTRVPLPLPRLVRSDLVRGLLATGAGFLGMAFAALLISSTDVLVVAQVLGPEVVPTYSVPFALLLLFVGLEMAVLDALWPAYVEAAASADRRWIQVVNRNTTIAFVGASLVFATGLIVLGSWFIEGWAGPEAVPPLSLLIVLGCIAVVQGVLLPHGRLLSALGGVRRNTGLSLAGAAVNLPVSIVLAAVIGVTGVAVGTLAAYLVTGFFVVRSARRAVRAVPQREDPETTEGPPGAGETPWEA